jgi:hypothetical protein
VDTYYITPRHLLKDLVYAIIISAVISGFLTFTGITTKSFVINLIVSQSFGVSIYLIIHFLFWVFKPEKMASVVFIVMIGIAGGTLIGLQIGPFVLLRIFSIALWQ